MGTRLNLCALVLGAGLVGIALAVDEEPAAFGRIREFSAKVRQRAMQVAASTLAEEQAAVRAAELAALPDQLKVHGSWTPGESVRHAFGLQFALPDPDTRPLSAGDGDPVASLLDDAQIAPEPVSNSPSPRMLRDDLPPPTEHHVTLVILGDNVARAVVDAAVVNLGDSLGEGRIVQIHSHGLVVRGPHGLVAYDVGAVDGRRLYDDELDDALDDAPPTERQP